MRWKPIFILTTGLLGAALHAGPRTSASYNVATDTADTAGRRTVSANYTNDGGLGGIAGVSTVATPAETIKQGYIAQLYEVTALQLAAAPPTVNETTTRQLSGVQLLDDATTLAVPASSITWSIQSGPLSINASGLATAATVYQDTVATAQGVFVGNTGTLGLTVLNSIPDNYGSYAGDGIGDDWQVLYFGLNNPNAAPSLDPDFDGLGNLLEWATYLNPTASSILPAATVLNGANLEFTYIRSVSAFNAGTVFAVEWSDTLPGPNPWSITGVIQNILSDNGTVQQVKATVPAGAGGHRFVHLKVAGP